MQGVAQWEDLHYTLHTVNQLARARGSLHLTFDRNEVGQSQMRVLDQQPPLRVIRAFAQADGAALVHLHNVSGGILGGDQLRVTAEVQEGAHAVLTTTGATRIYRHRSGGPVAGQHNQFVVRESALLELLPDATIPYAGARFAQQTQIHLGEDAGLFCWEVLAAGREARGEVFAYELFKSTLDIVVDGWPIASERICLEPGLRRLDSPLRMGRYRTLATFYACRVGVAPARWLEIERTLNELCLLLSQSGDAIWGVTTLPAHGIVVRALSLTQRAVVTALPSVWQAAKQAIYGRDAIMPRKIY
jgi:urease accessory protein